MNPKGELAGGTVIPNPLMTDFARAARNPEQGGSGGDSTAVVAAVQALGQKLDAVVTALNASGDFVLQVGDEKFGRVINKHFYQPGYQRIDIKKAAK